MRKNRVLELHLDTLQQQQQQGQDLGDELVTSENNSVVGIENSENCHTTIESTGTTSGSYSRVESNSSICSTINSHIMNMVCKIHSNNRICVSGTPFGHNKLYDIYNLLKFLYIQPLSYQFYWNNIIYKPILYIPLQKRLNILYFLFKNRILRRTKQKIKKELDLPELQIVKQTLTFSTFEVILSFL